MKHQRRKRKGDKEEGREEKEKGDKVIPEDMEEEKRRECFEVEEQKVMRKKWRERDKEKRGRGETRDTE